MDRLPDIMTGSLGAIPAALEHAGRFSLCKSADGRRQRVAFWIVTLSLIGLLAVPSLKRGGGSSTRASVRVTPRWRRATDELKRGRSRRRTRRAAWRSLRFRPHDIGTRRFRAVFRAAK